MVQGDEPMTHPNMISEAVTPMLDDPEILVSNCLVPQSYGWGLL